MGRSCRASKEGLAKAQVSIKVQGWTQDHLAGRANCSRAVVINFFAGRRVEMRLFQAICNEMNLDWVDIADLESEEQLSRDNKDEIIQELSGTTQVLNPPTSTTQQQSTSKRKAMVVLTAKLTADNQAQLQDKKIEIEAIVAHLRQLVGDVTLTIQDVEEGSIKIRLEGSDEGIERLLELFESGELTEVLGIPLEDIQLLPDNLTQEDDDKSRLIREIVTQGASGRDLIDANLSGTNLSFANLRVANLRGADLSFANLRVANLRVANLRGADLSGANLKGTDLRGANLRGADLRVADLRVAKLSEADLSGANLNHANLSHANLTDANLSGTDLSNAIVTNAFFGRNLGLIEDMKRDLERRGARFGDRPPVLNPR
ncbi:hypothetical protein BV378_15440 [Nostoc sp. RF31YmG]|nr:hypothetical protein BV378_15440 [Nostoc sp. RF31YmG]